MQGSSFAYSYDISCFYILPQSMEALFLVAFNAVTSENAYLIICVRCCCMNSVLNGFCVE